MTDVVSHAFNCAAVSRRATGARRVNFAQPKFGWCLLRELAHE